MAGKTWVAEDFKNSAQQIQPELVEIRRPTFLSDYIRGRLVNLCCYFLHY